MTAGPWFPTTTCREKILRSQFDIDTDTYKCALFQSTSNLSPASTTFAALTNEVAASYGYTAGGAAVTFTLAGSRSVTGSFVSNPIWVASGGSIIGRFGVIYEVGGDVAFMCMLDRTSTAVADMVFGAPTGDNVTITSAANLPVVPTGTLFEVGGHSNSANNGMYIATGVPTSSSLPATKLSGASPAAAASSAATVYVGANVTAADGSLIMIDADGTPNPVFTLA